MHLYHDSAGPRIDSGVAARLRRLDPNLAVTFCRYIIDAQTSLPLEMELADRTGEERLERRGGSEYFVDPAFHLWIKDRLIPGNWLLIKSYPAESGFGHREVAELEADVGRYMTPSEIVRTHEERKEANARKRQRAQLALRRDVAKANMTRIKRLVEGDRGGDRQARAFSYGGQGSRGTPGTIRRDNREDGWETPKPGDY